MKHGLHHENDKLEKQHASFHAYLHPEIIGFLQGDKLLRELCEQLHEEKYQQ